MVERRTSALLGPAAWIAISFSVVFQLVCASPSEAQATQAAIVGVITDTSGAILPGVTIAATGPALQVPSLTAVSDARGE